MSGKKPGWILGSYLVSLIKPESESLHILVVFLKALGSLLLFHPISLCAKCPSTPLSLDRFDHACMYPIYISIYSGSFFFRFRKVYPSLGSQLACDHGRRLAQLDQYAY